MGEGTGSKSEPNDTVTSLMMQSELELVCPTPFPSLHPFKLLCCRPNTYIYIDSAESNDTDRGKTGSSWHSSALWDGFRGSIWFRDGVPKTVLWSCNAMQNSTLFFSSTLKWPIDSVDSTDELQETVVYCLISVSYRERMSKELSRTQTTIHWSEFYQDLMEILNSHLILFIWNCLV